jgi:iron complex transport system substrate-binding protein
LTAAQDVAPGRIISLIASATEIVCALGLEDQLVGRSHECDYPESVKRLPVCTAPKFNIEGSSYDIDQRVKAILQEGLSVYRVDAEKLKELRPRVIITQTQCEVCAVSQRDVEQALGSWLGEEPCVVSLASNSLADDWHDIQRTALALAVPQRGNELIEKLQQRLRAITEKTRTLTARPGVACIEWIDPLMAAGNWMPELVELAGGVNLFGAASKHSPWMTWPELRTRDPDIIVVMPCGFETARSRRDMPALTQQPEWGQLRAVQNRRVYLADGSQYFNRPGPRLVESLEILAEILHPGEFHYGHEGIGWERF